MPGQQPSNGGGVPIPGASMPWQSTPTPSGMPWRPGAQMAGMMPPQMAQGADVLRNIFSQIPGLSNFGQVFGQLSPFLPGLMRGPQAGQPTGGTMSGPLLPQPTPPTMPTAGGAVGGVTSGVTQPGIGPQVSGITQPGLGPQTSGITQPQAMPSPLYSPGGVAGGGMPQQPFNLAGWPGGLLGSLFRGG